MLPFVPQRKAAKKASEQLREQDMWKKTQQEMLLANLQQAQLDKAAGTDTKKRGRQNKKKKGAAGPNSDSDAELFRRRRRSSDSSSSSSSSSSGSDSDSEAERARSPRGGRVGKSPKGAKKAAAKTQSPRPAKAPAVKRQRNTNNKKSPRGSRPYGVISSSKVSWE